MASQFHIQRAKERRREHQPKGPKPLPAAPTLTSVNVSRTRTGQEKAERDSPGTQLLEARLKEEVKAFKGFGVQLGLPKQKASMVKVTCPGMKL